MKPVGLSVSFPKGGTGKTFSTLNIAGGLNANGANVLVFDIDPQGSLTANLGYSHLYEDTDRLSLDEVLLDLSQFEDFPELIIPDNEFDFVPANATFHKNKTPLDSVQAAEKRLRRLLGKIDEDHPDELPYHYIVMDCPPDFSTYTKNAIVACENIVAPITPISEAVHSTRQLISVKEDTELLQNVPLELLAFILTLDYQGGLTKQEQEIKEWFEDTYGDRGFEVKQLAAFDRAKQAHTSIFQHAESLRRPELGTYQELIDFIIEQTNPPEYDGTARKDLLDTSISEIREEVEG